MDLDDLREERALDNCTIGVVIPTHRDRGFLADTLHSVLTQLRGDDTVFLCANGCSAEYLASLDKHVSTQLKLVRVPVSGIAHARNAGVAGTRGGYLLFLDDDDELLPGALDSLRVVLDRDPSIVAVVGNVRTFGSHGEHEVNRTVTDLAEFPWASLLSGPPTASMGSALIRRSAFEQAGGLDESLAPADDWDLWLKLARIGKVVGLRTSTLRYRQHASNTSADVRLLSLRALSVFRRHEGNERSAALGGRGRRQALGRLRRWYTPLLFRSALGYVRRGEFGRAIRCGGAAFALNASYAARLLPVRSST